MSYVDRSGTNWSPWPRLAGVNPRLQVVGGVAAMMGAAGVVLVWRNRVGGQRPGTMSKEWKKDEEERGYAAEMESNADPVVLNPITKSLGKK